MDIDKSKIYALGCSLESIADGSVRLIKTVTETAKPQETLAIVKNYYNNVNEYTVRVNLPPTPKPGTVIIVSRTSVNCWRLIVCSKTDVSVNNYKTLTEINGQLHTMLDK